MKMLYVTEGGRLVGMQDVSAWTARQKYKATIALQTINRNGFVADCGMAVCCICRKLLGFRDIPAGELSHGYCPECLASEAEKIKIMEVKNEISSDNHNR